MLPTFQSTLSRHYHEHSPNVQQYLTNIFKDYVLRRISEIPEAQSTSNSSSNDTQSEDKKYDTPQTIAQRGVPFYNPAYVPINTSSLETQYTSPMNTESIELEPKIGAYTRAQRQKKINKYKLKQRKYLATHKKCRVFNGRSRMACIKPRINGRFVKTSGQ